ncbi:Csr2p KNAG_0B02150 [Huiozyma naganishii CBS 8797]|uniref:Arrestin C-terminal-like domain-containing protein n=1 Tax=Huiozyma naganishii (strain ATCC MYA-139 / BCRC 22969 / CBS 8797 / KCTC 17520 / NBRC 10181 / NCYC 3082 / Yp74L-3) TaxID=1071383 RepID=J7RUW1_HUIN7|nr:hypothetical protein KNAG_0B02150 [Kazachstania naganishii CBS 8797]CCK68657.1 hypothetical protein KNAG_0B02150 [Kazachstania naganishii CBS 8797]
MYTSMANTDYMNAVPDVIMEQDSSCSWKDGLETSANSTDTASSSLVYRSSYPFSTRRMSLGNPVATAGAGAGNMQSWPTRVTSPGQMPTSPRSSSIFFENPAGNKNNYVYSTMMRRSSSASSDYRLLFPTELTRRHSSVRSSQAATSLQIPISHGKSCIGSLAIEETAFKRPGKLRREITEKYLSSNGFLPRTQLYHDHAAGMAISVATSSNAVFLPTISNNEDEYLERINAHRRSGAETHSEDTTTALLTSENGDSDTVLSDDVGSDLADINEWQQLDNINDSSSSINGSRRRCSSIMSRSTAGSIPNSAPQPVEVNSSMAHFKIAVVISLKKEVPLSTVELELCSRVQTEWADGAPPLKITNKESYKVSEMDWQLNAANYNLFIPTDVSSLDQTNENFQRIRNFRFWKNKQRSDRTYITDEQFRRELFEKIGSGYSKSGWMKPGEYIYLVPIIFNNRIPETLFYPSAKVEYCLRIAAVVKEPDTSQKKSGSYLSKININGKGSDTSSSPLSTSYDSVANNNSRTESQNSKSIFKKVKNHLHRKTSNADTVVVAFGQEDAGHVAKDNDSSTNIPTSVDITDPSFVYGGNSPASAQSAFQHLSPKEIYLEYPINVVRTPPQISVSTADKPVYINKVWGGALAYEIVVPHKFIPLGSKIPIEIKLTPLIKDVQVNKVAVCVTEKITISNKTNKFQFKETDKCLRDTNSSYYHIFLSKRQKERMVILYELRTKNRGSRALREDTVLNTLDNNLLSFNKVYDAQTGCHQNLIDPLKIETELEFPKFSEEQEDILDKNFRPYGIDSYYAEQAPPTTHQESESRKNGLIQFFFNSNKFSGSSENDKTSFPKDTSVKSKLSLPHEPNVGRIEVRKNKLRRGLYLDSTHFRNIKCKHKLEIILRVNKPGENNEMKQYEVVINTPIYLISEMCLEET